MLMQFAWKIFIVLVDPLWITKISSNVIIWKKKVNKKRGNVIIFN